MSHGKKIKPPVLREHEEEEILHHIIEKAGKNETVRREEVNEIVVKFLKSDNRKNPFRNGTPGDKWFSLFRRRHNEHFLKLKPEQLRIVERIGFTEKVMNTVTYKPNSVVKRQMPILDSSWSPSTPKRKRKPKEFKEFVSSTPNERHERISTPAVSRNHDTSEVIVTSPTSDESSNVNTDDGDRSQESQSDSTDFQPGIKLEVMDFNDDKWYSVRVVEVDYEEGEVLVHFEKWSNRYDEWVRMDSNRIRRPRLSSSPVSEINENDSKAKLLEQTVSDSRSKLLEQAVSEVKKGKLSVRAAAKKYSLPKSTIGDHVSGKYKGTPGKPPVFSPQEENDITAHAEQVASWGFPFSRFELRLLAKCYLEKGERNVPIFKNNLPGEEWVDGFLNRNNSLRLKMCRNITARRAKIDAVCMASYFENLKVYLDKIPKENIINYDETNLSDDPGSKNVIFKRGTKYPDRALNSSKNTISIMFAGSAGGEVLPPYVCYKAEHLWDSWVTGGPDGARYNRSESGLIDEATFRDWFKTIVLPWSKSKVGSKVMIGDNFSTHFSADVITLCQQNDIHFVCLPPNASQLLQPLDVAFFQPLEQAWRQILLEWKMGADRRLKTLPKKQFPPLLKTLCEEISENATKNLQSGFRTCGIYPLDPQQVIKKLSASDVSVSRTKNARQLVGETVIKMMSQLRHDSPAANALKKKKINGAAETSISQNILQKKSGAGTTLNGEDVCAIVPSTSSTKNKRAVKRETKRTAEEAELSSGSDESSESDESDDFYCEDSSDEWTEEPPEDDNHLILKDPEIKDSWDEWAEEHSDDDKHLNFKVPEIRDSWDKCTEEHPEDGKHISFKDPEIRDSGYEWTEEQPEDDKHLIFKDLEIRDYLLLKFPWKKSVRFYVGVVEEKNVYLSVRCARNIGDCQFKWPNPEDRCTIDYDQIEKRLEPPICNYKNGRLVSFSFRNDFAGYSVS